MDEVSRCYQMTPEGPEPDPDVALNWMRQCEAHGIWTTMARAGADVIAQTDCTVQKRVALCGGDPDA